eukprot:8281535-Heterocapsa_arctica.AAC.1
MRRRLDVVSAVACHHRTCSLGCAWNTAIDDAEHVIPRAASARMSVNGMCSRNASSIFALTSWFRLPSFFPHGYAC